MQIWWSCLTRKKITLRIRGEILEEVKEAIAMSCRSLSSLVREYFGYLVSER